MQSIIRSMRGPPSMPSPRCKCPVAKAHTPQRLPHKDTSLRMPVFSAIAGSDEPPADDVLYVPIDPSSSRPGGRGGNSILPAVDLSVTSGVVPPNGPSDPAHGRPGGRDGGFTFPATVPDTSNVATPTNPVDPAGSRPGGCGGSSFLPASGTDTGSAIPTTVPPSDPAGSRPGGRGGSTLTVIATGQTEYPDGLRTAGHGESTSSINTPGKPEDPAVSRPGGRGGSSVLPPRGLDTGPAILTTVPPSDPAGSRPGGRGGSSFLPPSGIDMGSPIPTTVPPSDPAGNRPGGRGGSTSNVMASGKTVDLAGDRSAGHGESTSSINTPGKPQDPTVSRPGGRGGSSILPPPRDLNLGPAVPPSDPAGSRPGGRGGSFVLPHVGPNINSSISEAVKPMDPAGSRPGGRSGSSILPSPSIDTTAIVDLVASEMTPDPDVSSAVRLGGPGRVGDTQTDAGGTETVADNAPGDVDNRRSKDQSTAQFMWAVVALGIAAAALSHTIFSSSFKQQEPPRVASCCSKQADRKNVLEN